MTKCKCCKKDDEGTGVIYLNKNVCQNCWDKYSSEKLMKKLKIELVSS